MKQRNRFVFDMLDQDMPQASEDSIYRAGAAASVREEAGNVAVEIPFYRQSLRNLFLFRDKQSAPRRLLMSVRAYGCSIVRLAIGMDGAAASDDDNPMIRFDSSLRPEGLRMRAGESGWDVLDEAGRVRLALNSACETPEIWSRLQPEPEDCFDAHVRPDSEICVPFMAHDEFFPQQPESFSLGFVERQGKVDRWLFSLHAGHDERFAGTGERFAPMNLAGRTFVMENTDALGNNSRRAYKNVPFFISSRGYGLLIMTSGHVRLSLADISTRAAQALVEDSRLDLFFIGGGSIERILYNYRRITGFPASVPFWSYGTWMAKMSYFSAEETRLVVKRMREGRFPFDVIHLDTGWFDKDWKCEWQFSEQRFPDAERYLKEMACKGVRISLWQLPCIAKGTKYYETAKENRYFAPKSASVPLGSNFSEVEFDGNIDFTNPKATEWYKGLLRQLLKMGVSVIKTDFGEVIDENADYQGLPYRMLHNMYSLLYQKAAYEASAEVKGQGSSMIWARAGWIGCQRYPVHWSGDCACSWDGMAGALRGGLHLGLSGFGFWSHDVPGFHGVPSFMNSRPADDLYVRWTQMGVFSSHLRYHGTNLREPYEYPNISDIVRKWLMLRYALIPYLAQQGEKATVTGYPILRALIFDNGEDPACWTIDDEFFCGDSFLVAPVMNGEGIRDVYLPAGEWIDFWTGKEIHGGKWLKRVHCPLEVMPVFVRKGASVPVYPNVVQCTDEMVRSEIRNLVFDEGYQGFMSSLLGSMINLRSHCTDCYPQSPNPC